MSDVPDDSPARAVSVEPSPEPASLRSRSDRTLLAALIATAPIAPVLAIVSTVLLYIGGGPNGHPVAWGAIVAIVLWVIGATVATPFMTMERANRSVYRSLVTRVAALDTAAKSPSPETAEHIVRLGEELDVPVSRSVALSELLRRSNVSS